jgi:hypothetical protein
MRGIFFSNTFGTGYTFKTLGQFNIFWFSQGVLAFKLMAIKCLSFKRKGQQSNDSLNLKCGF